QLTLLGGYLYAHLVSRIGMRAQLAVHAALLGCALATLPFAVSTASAEAPVISLLVVLTVSLGLPVFALSATAPLLQRWFSRSGHPHAGDPYFLYSASNAGSLLALVAYPLALEPLLGLRQQTLAWSGACAFFAALVFACGAALWRTPAKPAASAPAGRS